MTEENKGQQGMESQEHWSDNHEDIKSNTDLHTFAKRYKSEGELTKAAFEGRQKLSASFRLPDDLKTLSEEQRAEILNRVKGLRDIPKDAAGYAEVIKIPEGYTKSDALVNAISAFAFERGWDKGDVAALSDVYHQALAVERDMFEETRAKKTAEAEMEFRARCGKDFDNTCKAVDRALMLATDELGLNYLDDKGQKRSKLVDCLNDAGDGKQIPLGNKIPIVMLLRLLYEKHYKEGSPIDADTAGTGKGSNFFDYKTVD